MALINGDDLVDGDLVSFQEENRIKNHWRNNIAQLTNPSEGMIRSDPTDNILSHCWVDSTPGPIEWRLIRQACDDTFVINPGGGGDYTTIAAAMAAENAGGELFLVAPGTYVETITFSADNQVVRGMGKGPNTIVTQVDANVVDVNTRTGCRVQDIRLSLSAPTTAIYLIQASTGEAAFIDCQLHLATAVALVAAAQPALVNISGAGTIVIKRGRAEYYHTGNTGGGGIKCAFIAGANGAFLHLHKVDRIIITNSGTALATCIFSDFGTAIAEMHVCVDCVVTDPGATNVIGMGYIGAAGVHNIMGNHIDVVATNNIGYGLYHGGTGAIRTSHNAIHVTDAAGTSYSFFLGASAMLESHFDEWRADDGPNITAGAVLDMVSSEDEGELSWWGYLTADTAPHYVRARMDDTNDEFEVETENDSALEGFTLWLREDNQAFRIRTGARVLAYEHYPFTATGPYSRILDVDQDSEFEYGFWADDVGLLTVPANPLRENILTNTGIWAGTWSQSDANKGIAELVFDNGTVAPVVGEAIVGVSGTGKVMWVNVTNNDWAGGNGAGTCYLGSTTGAYEDNETIAGSVAAAFDVNGDLDVGVKNDPCNDNSVASWTDDGAGIVLAFVAAEYSVTTTAINQRAWIANAPLLAGHIYKIEIDINDGTAAGVDIEGYFDDGAAQYGRIETTAAGWASVSWVFECATDDAAGDVGFRIPANLGGNNIQMRRFSCYEITPGCTAADAVAFDGWYKHTGTDIYREHWGNNTKCGSFYSLKMVPTGIDQYVLWPTGINSKEEWYKSVCDRTVSLGAWVKTSTANHIRLYMDDGVGTMVSSFHSGGGNFEWLEATRTIASNANTFYCGILTSVAGDIDGSTIVYVSQPMLVFGASIGEGNYRPRQQEQVWLEEPLPSNTLYAAGFSNVGETTLNLEADSDARLPKGVKAIQLQMNSRDSGSAAVNCYIQLRLDATVTYRSIINSPYGLANDANMVQSAWIRCWDDGDITYQIVATGANTFDTYMLYLAVQVN